LASFGFLSAEEKIVVPLIAQFSLKTAFNLSTEEEDVSLVQDIQDYFEEQPNLRPLEIIKIANNLSKSIVVSIKNNYETLQKHRKSRTNVLHNWNKPLIKNLLTKLSLKISSQVA
jgi:hypothetical protein